jgi:hypothetical protein
MECIFPASMTFIIYYTTIAYITMYIFSVITYSANTAFVTVEIISFHAIIKKIALFAEILGEFNSTICALIANILLMITFGAYNFFYFKAVNFMGFIFIMTKAACINFATARGYKFAITNIVFAAVHSGSFWFFLFVTSSIYFIHFFFYYEKMIQIIDDF